MWLHGQGGAPSPQASSCASSMGSPTEDGGREEREAEAFNPLTHSLCAVGGCPHPSNQAIASSHQLLQGALPPGLPRPGSPVSSPGASPSLLISLHPLHTFASCALLGAVPTRCWMAQPTPSSNSLRITQFEWTLSFL